jgi:hypothetical protein
MLASPSVAPLQLTPELTIAAETASGLTALKLELAEQPFASFTVAV